MVSGSILRGQHKSQKKLQNLLQKQSPLEFPLTHCSWDPDWPWLNPCPPHQYRPKDTVHGWPEKFHFSAIPYWDKFMLLLRRYLVLRGRRTKTLDIRHVLSSLTSKLPRLSLPHEDSKPALFFSSSGLLWAFVSCLFKHCYSRAYLRRAELK